MRGNITYVKNQSIGVAAGVTSAVQIDLGLAINEGARILGIQASIELSALTTADNLAAAWMSFDPGDIISAVNDDEQFWHLGAGTQYLTEGGMMSVVNDWTDYSHLNLITTRNLSLIFGTTGSAGGCEVKVFFEKFTPTKDELVGLIAHRR